MYRCVISSFITKPQLDVKLGDVIQSCVISSFITKPQQCVYDNIHVYVALYPLSSPNHNFSTLTLFCARVALYPLSSPNHNLMLIVFSGSLLRYILFHHQTTTFTCLSCFSPCCVISSFITKPQRYFRIRLFIDVALYPLSSPNHNTSNWSMKTSEVALYPLSSPNHNCTRHLQAESPLRYILFHHQTTTKNRS